MYRKYQLIIFSTEKENLPELAKLLTDLSLLIKLAEERVKKDKLLLVESGLKAGGLIEPGDHAAESAT